MFLRDSCVQQEVGSPATCLVTRGTSSIVVVGPLEYSSLKIAQNIINLCLSIKSLSFQNWTKRFHFFHSTHVSSMSLPVPVISKMYVVPLAEVQVEVGSAGVDCDNRRYVDSFYSVSHRTDVCVCRTMYDQILDYNYKNSRIIPSRQNLQRNGLEP